MLSVWDELNGGEQEPLDDDGGEGFQEDFEESGGPVDDTTDEPVPAGEGTHEETAEDVPPVAEATYDHLPEEYRLGTFEDEKSELEALRGIYKNFSEKFGSDDFINGFLDRYAEQLAKADERISQDMQDFLAFKNNREEYVKASFPEIAIQAGIPFVPSDDSISEQISQVMTQKYGEGWQEMYDESDRFKHGSLSQSIYRDWEAANKVATDYKVEMQQKHQQYLQQLQQPQAQKNSQQGLTAQEEQIILEEQFKVFEQAGYSREEYQRAVDEIMAKKSELTFLHVHRALNFDKLVEEERKKAFEEGRKSFQQTLKKAGKLAAVKESELAPRPKANGKSSGGFDKMGYYRQIDNGF
jgi:hypothetical protein